MFCMASDSQRQALYCRFALHRTILASLTLLAHTFMLTPSVAFPATDIPRLKESRDLRIRQAHGSLIRRNRCERYERALSFEISQQSETSTWIIAAPLARRNRTTWIAFRQSRCGPGAFTHDRLPHTLSSRKRMQVSLFYVRPVAVHARVSNSAGFDCGTSRKRFACAAGSAATKALQRV